MVDGVNVGDGVDGVDGGDGGDGVDGGDGGDCDGDAEDLGGENDDWKLVGRHWMAIERLKYQPGHVRDVRVVMFVVVMVIVVITILLGICWRWWCEDAGDRGVGE